MSKVEYLPLPSGASPEGVLRRTLEAVDDLEHVLTISIDKRGGLRLLRTGLKPTQVIGMLELAKAFYVGTVDVEDVNHEGG